MTRTWEELSQILKVSRSDQIQIMHVVDVFDGTVVAFWASSNEIVCKRIAFVNAKGHVTFNLLAD